jgi:tRNA G18 (ribose-2'-O)-methylase SpoU
MLLAAPAYRPLSLLIAAHKLPGLATILTQVPADVPIFVADRPVLDAVAGFALHRGILAVGARVRRPTAEELLGAMPEQATVALLSGIANHDNIGGIFRNAAAFGVKGILLDSDCCDPLYRKAIRVSVGAVFRTPFAMLDRGEDPISLLDAHSFRTLSLSPSGSLSLSDVVRAPRTALVLGAEGSGLAPEMLSRTTSVRITMAPGLDSLNVATSSGIALHHLMEARSAIA